MFFYVRLGIKSKKLMLCELYIQRKKYDVNYINYVVDWYYINYALSVVDWYCINYAFEVEERY